MVAAAKRGDFLKMLCLGVRASVVAQPYMGRMVRILPGIDSLPEDAQHEAAVPENGEAVVILLFDSLHRYAFVYEALRDFATECAPSFPTCTAMEEEDIEQREGSVLRVWLRLEAAQDSGDAGAESSQCKSIGPSAGVWQLLGNGGNRAQR